MSRFPNRRVLLAVAVGPILATTALAPAAGHAGFGDVTTGDFYAEAVQWMVDNDITTGTSPGCFSPHDTVTRGQFAAFLWRMSDEPAAPPHRFGDVSAPWQQDPVSWLAHTGVTTGTSPTTYSPDQPVTRGQLAAFLYRYAGEPELTLDGSSPGCGVAADDEFAGGPVDLKAGATPPWTLENGHLAEVADIDRTTPGQLVLVPTQTPHNGWYAATNGPIVYQPVSGNFAVAVRIRVVSAADPTGGQPPGPGYNSGGFVVRDATDRDDWVMYNMGNQAAGFGYGREVKTTVDASSVLNLYPQAETTHRLLVCRVGTELHYFHGAATGGGWSEEALHHVRPDIGSDVHVGIVANAWEGGPRPWIAVEAMHFGAPSSLDECTTSVAAV